MKYRKTILGGLFFALVLLFGARIGRAQDEPQEPADTMPKPAARTTPIPIIDTGNPQDDNGVQIRPDVTPLTGLQTATLGTPELQHSYWVPGFQYANTVQSSGYNQPSSSGWFATNYLIANVSLLQAWSRSQLAVNYSGGSYFSTNSTQGNGNYQESGRSQTFQSNRSAHRDTGPVLLFAAICVWFRWGDKSRLPGQSWSPLPPLVPGLGGGGPLGTKASMRPPVRASATLGAIEAT